jgi:tRNA(Ile)-lysidine synthase
MMNIVWPAPGKYVVAVSGGVDSVVLLDLLIKHGAYDLVVAHVDHGVREDSGKDAELVQALAAGYQISCLSKRLNVEKASSEEQLRKARYEFLFESMKQTEAKAILTAHHANDLLETSIMNVRRGTDRYGAAGGMTRQGIIRPLINVTKKELLNYSQVHNLAWREDTTNVDVKYTRNKVRHEVIPKIDTVAYQQHLEQLGQLNASIDDQLKELVSISEGAITIPRVHVNQLSLRELEVALAYGLRHTRPDIELSRARIAQAARQIMLGTDKISFSTGLQDCIIIDIP